MDRLEENHRVEENQGSLRDFLYVIFKHKAKILTIFLAIVVTVTAGSFIMAPTYEATSKVLVKFGRENVYATTSQSQGGSGQLVFDTGREERINSEVELLKGRALISKVIADIGVQNIYPDAIQAFSSLFLAPSSSFWVARSCPQPTAPSFPYRSNWKSRP